VGWTGIDNVEGEAAACQPEDISGGLRERPVSAERLRGYRDPEPHRCPRAGVAAVEAESRAMKGGDGSADSS
jgi:hypothetical protein